MSIRVRRRIKSCLRMRAPWMREILAEFIGTFVLMVFGTASVAQHVLSAEKAGGFLSVNWAWGLAVAMGVWVSGGVSGGHINPAVSLTFCIMGRLQWRKLPGYWFGQYFGAIAASACVYGVYSDALDAFDGGIRQVTGTNGTAGIWATYPKDFLSAGTGLADQVLATALLLCLVLAITDDRNMGAPKGLQPFCIGLVVVLIGLAFGFNCGYAINPARDWGPRIFTAIAGWGKGVFSFRDYNWFWVPFVGPHIGAILGAWAYMLFIAVHYPDEDEDPDDEDSIRKEATSEEKVQLTVQKDNNTVGVLKSRTPNKYDWFGDQNQRGESV